MMNEFWYNFKEILIPSTTDFLGIAGFLKKVETLHSTSQIENTLALLGLSYEDLYGIKEVEGVTEVDDSSISQLLYLIKNRFSFHYIGFDKTDEEVGGFPHFLSTEKALEWAEKFAGILLASYPKYKVILDIYSANISKLMNPLANSRSSSSHLDRAHSDSSSKQETKSDDYEIDATGKNLHNDTPQTTDVVATLEDNLYVNDLDRSEAHTENSGSTQIYGTDSASGEVHDSSSGSESGENDVKYTMEKIAEIQESFQKVLYKWSDEFSGLFIEEDNI